MVSRDSIHVARGEERRRVEREEKKKEEEKRRCCGVTSPPNPSLPLVTLKPSWGRGTATKAGGGKVWSIYKIRPSRRK